MLTSSPSSRSSGPTPCARRAITKLGAVVAKDNSLLFHHFFELLTFLRSHRLHALSHALGATGHSLSVFLTFHTDLPQPRFHRGRRLGGCAESCESERTCGHEQANCGTKHGDSFLNSSVVRGRRTLDNVD